MTEAERLARLFAATKEALGEDWAPEYTPSCVVTDGETIRVSVVGCIEGAGPTLKVAIERTEAELREFCAETIDRHRVRLDQAMARQRKVEEMLG